MNLDQLVDSFEKNFGTKAGTLRFFAPGRVNLIGEHTDYNGGHVFPCALSVGTYIVARRRNDAKLRMLSLNFEAAGMMESDMDKLTYDPAHSWANYPKGVVKIFKDAGFAIETGFDALFYGDIPNASGLSSSASIELATSIMLKTLYGLNIDMVEMVKYSQKSENEFNGVNCGIMDQFACGMGKKDHAVFLNTNTLEYTYVPVKLDGVSIIIANTNKKRGLADSKYNERRSECERALGQLKKVLDITALGDLTEAAFESHAHLIGNDVERKRAKHAVYENRRTIKAVEALNEGNLALFGELMNASHVSLRDDYEVTGAELDTLVEAAWANGAIGARMTGGGFGGCTVNMVPSSSIPVFIEKVGKAYEEKIGYKADFYVVSIGDGAREI